MSPPWFKPAPQGLLPLGDTKESIKQGDRWIRAQTMWWPGPPTEEVKTGYVAVAILDETGKPTGIFKVGLNPKWDKEGLKEDAESCEQEWKVYLERIEKYWDRGKVILKPRKPPYLVNVVAHTCVRSDTLEPCPDVEQGNICHHIMGIEYVHCYDLIHIQKNGVCIIKKVEE